MPETLFLDSPLPPAAQVAKHLLERSGNDLRRVEVWCPTAGAGRRIRRALAERGVLSPRISQPLRAMLPDSPDLARRFEREAAWARVLREAPPAHLEPLFSGTAPDSEDARLKSAGVLCDLADLLAESGCDPCEPRLAEVCAEDSPRWDALAELYRDYLAVLEHHGLRDPDAARFAEIANPTRASHLDRLVIACIPDLPLAACLYAKALQKSGVRVEVLVWLPGEMAGGFDEWGRPDPAAWADCRLPVAESQIHGARSPDEEAAAALDFALASKTPGDYALILADPSLGAAFRAEVEPRGGRAFLPDGSRIDLSEPGMIALEWDRFREGGDLRVLRRLLELPRFNRVVRLDLKTDDILAACDYLVGEAVLSDFDQAVAFANVVFDPATDPLTRRAQAQALVARVGELRRWSVTEILREAWKSGGADLETARKVDALHRAVSESPLYANDSSGLESAFARALKSEPLFESSDPGDVELSGWLEAPWVEAERLALCGCVEGVLPSSVNGHPFLPDSKRRDLGLADNASRFARDAYLFQCLLHARSAAEFHCAFSRFDAVGAPLLPSRLFLRCHEEELPVRFGKLFGDPGNAKSRATRVNSWRWDFPESLRRKVEKMSPTDFSQYLACPFRFYLGKVLRLDAFLPDAREMDAKRFGLLVHEALEHFGRQTPDESDPAVIERLVLGHLDAAAHSLFGPDPSPAIRIQIEGARARLRAFARVQAEEFARGWRIVATEEKLKSDGPNPLAIGPLALSGKIDRIEKNIDSGAWRIIDYKTYASPKPPAKQHFGPRLQTEWLAEAELEIPGARNPKKKRWADLQLPLYHRILHHLYGDRIGSAPVSTGYFLLCADPAATALVEFTELTDDILASALSCAEAIAQRVHDGVFWPPQPPKGSWQDPFEPFFLNGKPESCLSPSTIEFLEGNL